MYCIDKPDNQVFGFSFMYVNKYVNKWHSEWFAWTNVGLKDVSYVLVSTLTENDDNQRKFATKYLVILILNLAIDRKMLMYCK